ALLHHTRANGTPCTGPDCPLSAALTGAGTIASSVDNEVFWRRDGSSFPVEYSLTAVKEVGSVVGVVVFRDATGRKRIELERTRLFRELEEAVHARDDFLSIASHELKTPLTPIRLGVQLLQRRIQRGAFDPGESLGAVNNQLDSMNRQVRRLDGLID